VLHCSWQGLTFLLPGDIQTDAMRHLVRLSGDRLPADLLVLPHHGRYADGLAEFLDAVQPAVAVASGRPDDCGPDTRGILHERGIPLWITGVEGAVTVTVKGRTATLTGFRSGRTMDLSPQGREGR
jgi:competence protein ComEC